MRTVLHIGAEKTGTTSLQSAFSANRHRLLNSAPGILYPRTLWGTQHWALGLFGMSDDRSNALGNRIAEFRNDRTDWRSTVRDRLALEIEDAAAQRPEVLLLSSEIMSAQLATPGEVRRLRALLDTWSSSYTVVVYLRRQDRAKTSLHSTDLRVGGTEEDPFGPYPFTPVGFDYDRILTMWAEVFGRENVRPRRYDPIRAERRDLLDDFADAADLPALADLERPPGTANPSLSAAAARLALEYNRAVGGPATDRVEQRARRLVIDQLAQRYPGPPRRPSAAQAREFLARYAEGNRKVSEEWFDGAPLFDDRFEEYPGIPDPEPEVSATDLMPLVASTAREGTAARVEADRQARRLTELRTRLRRLTDAAPEAPATAASVEETSARRSAPFGLGLRRREPREPAPTAAYPEPRFKAAVVQWEAVHEECLPALVHLLRLNAVEPTVHLTPKIMDRRPGLKLQFPEIADTIRYTRFHSGEDRKAVLRRIRRQGTDVLLCNTFQWPGAIRWANQWRGPLLGTVHHPWRVYTTPLARRMLAERRVGVLTLAPHVTARLHSMDPDVFASAATITSTFPIPPRVEPIRHERRTIAIPGSVNFITRDYRQVLDAMPRLLEAAEPSGFEFVLVGGGRDRERFRGMVEKSGFADHFRFADLNDEGFVATEDYYGHLLGADLLLPLVPPYDPTVRTTKITSAVPTSTGLRVPSIVDRWTASAYDALPGLCYEVGDLAAGIEDALTATPEELATLRRRLDAYRERDLARAADELGWALRNQGLPV